MRRFNSQDIGAELLPILTQGLYRNPFDAIREDAQNGIDAGASKLKIIVASNSVTVTDDGHGMTPSVAERAIRLGMSDKSPLSQVGFRGIGIYSAMHLCNELLIHTRDTSGRASLIQIDFKLARDLIDAQESDRLSGKESTLWLEAVLSEAVTVRADKDSPLLSSGTMVFLKNLSTDMGDRLKDAKGLESYLENAIPLPFRTDFHWGTYIQAELDAVKDRVIHVELTHSGQTREIYRPYSDSLFKNHRGVQPDVIEVVDSKSKQSFGHCWYCINDSNDVLRDRSLRGLLVKKFGFSVGDRHFLSGFFGRAGRAERITGEVIVSCGGLVPTAARDGFEAGPLRDSFYQALVELAKQIGEHVDKLQNERKALSLLAEVEAECQDIAKAIPVAAGDAQQLLALNVRLATASQRLSSHRLLLKKLAPGGLSRYDNLSKSAERDIAGLISTRKPSRPPKVARIMKRIGEQHESASERTDAVQEGPTSLIEVAEQLGLTPDASTTRLLIAIDERLLVPNTTPEQYAEQLNDLLDALEEDL